MKQVKEKESEGSVQRPASASFFKEAGAFMKPYSGLYTASVLISIIGVAAELGAYASLGVVLDLLFHGQRTAAAYLPGLIGVVVCKLLFVAFLNLSTWLSHKAAYRTLADMRSAMLARLVLLPLGYFERSGSGRLKTMLVDRVEEIEKTLAHLLPEMTANLLIPALMVIWMFMLDWRLALCVVGCIVVGFLVSMGMMRGYAEKYAGQIERFKTMNQTVVEYVGGIEVIKLFNRQDSSYRKFEEAVSQHAAYNVKWTRETQFFSALGLSISPASVFAVVMLGLYLWSSNSLAVETLMLFIVLSLGVFGPLLRAMGYFDQVAQMGTVAREINEIIHAPGLRSLPAAGERQGYGIELRDLRFAYDESRPPILNGISLKIPEGSMLALVGPSGSGKSTLAKMLVRYWDYSSGSILVGGRELASYTTAELNEMIAFVDQDTFLFPGSIMDNIRLGRPGASDEDVMEAAREAGIDDFIRALTEGYQTEAGVAGDKLSGGEKQRVAIARAILKNAPILVLDEATASTDPENETKIQNALLAAARDKTLIVVAHRLHSIVNADQIAFVQDGRVIATGTHTQMLEICQTYKELWKLTEGGQRTESGMKIESGGSEHA